MIEPTFHLPPEFKRARDLREFPRTLALAEVRCLTWNEIRPRIRAVWSDPTAEEVIRRVQELALSESEAAELADDLLHVASAADLLKGLDRDRADRRLLRLGRALPPAVRRERAEADLGHPRKIRRMGAYATLRAVGVSTAAAASLAACYQATGEQEALQLIARFPEAVGAADVDWLLGMLEDRYWRMRVLEGLIRTGDARVAGLRARYPWEFAYATGRVGAREVAPEIRALVAAHPGEWELAAMCAWALGKLADCEGVAEIRRLYDAEIIANPPPPFR